eukprot:scpid47944/ scgid21366/ Acid-sensing ion channel 3; Amiloride-sensitive cation channel 3; Dorsal root ASIC
MDTSATDQANDSSSSNNSAELNADSIFVDVSAHTDKVTPKKRKPIWPLSRFLHGKPDSSTAYEYHVDDDSDFPLKEYTRNGGGHAGNGGTSNGHIGQQKQTFEQTDEADTPAHHSGIDWRERKAMALKFTYTYVYLAACHGIARAMQNKASVARRLFWLLAFSGAVSMFFYQISLLVKQFTDYEFQVDVEFSFNRQLAFPAVTFCNLNPMNVKLLNCSRFHDECLQLAGANQSADGQLIKTDDAIGYAHEYNFSGEPITRAEYLQYGFLPEDMIITCTWNGEPCSARNFTISQNPFYGNCFTLNGDPKNPLQTNYPGREAGLALELYMNPDEGIGGETSTSSGVRMSLHQPGVKPFPDEDGFSLATGEATFIGVRQLEVSRLGSPYSNCTQENDNWKSLYPGYSYSRTACVQSCLAQEMFDRCGCVEIFLVDKPICNNANVNKEQADCAAGVRRDYRLDRLNCDLCYNPCVDRIYLHTLSKATWPAKAYQYSFRETLKELNFSDGNSEDSNAEEIYREKFLRAVVYFEELNYQRIVQKPAYPAENLFADFGGQMGLWAGLSFLAFVELFDYVGQVLLIALGLKKVVVLP